MARVMINDSPGGDQRQLTVFIERQLDASTQAGIIREAMKDIAKAFAEKWLEENRDKVIERLNVDAIANMVMLEVANDIKKDARKESNNG